MPYKKEILSKTAKESNVVLCYKNYDTVDCVYSNFKTPIPKQLKTYLTYEVKLQWINYATLNSLNCSCKFILIP